MRGRKSKHQKQLDAARLERDRVYREGEEQRPKIRRLERVSRENHFAELVESAFRIRRRKES